MSASILSFARRGRRPADWTQQELAEFYRVVEALSRAGLSVGTDRGVSDEGEPWFVFYRTGTEEIIAHFARIDGAFVADSAIVAEPVAGRDLAEVLNRIVGRYTVLLPRSDGGGLFLHPSALLAAFLTTALIELQRAEPAGDDAAAAPHAQDGDARDGARADAGAAARTPASPLMAALGQLARGVTSDGKAAADGAFTHGTAVVTAVLAAIGLLGEYDAKPAPDQAPEHAAEDDDTTPAETDGVGAHAKAPGPDPDAAGGGEAAPLDGKTDHAAGPSEPAAAHAADGEPWNGSADGQFAARFDVQFDDGGELFATDALPWLHTSGTTVAAESPAPEQAGQAPAAPQHEGAASDGGAEASASALSATHPEPQQTHAAAGQATAPVEVFGSALLVLMPDVASQLGVSHEALFMVSFGGDKGASPGAAQGNAQPAPSVFDAPSAAAAGPLNASDLVFSYIDAPQSSALQQVVSYVVTERAAAPKIAAPPDIGVATELARFVNDASKVPDVVIFHSDALSLASFAFAPGVVFVSDKAFDSLPSNLDGDTLTVDFANGGEITLLGVASYDGHLV